MPRARAIAGVLIVLPVSLLALALGRLKRKPEAASFAARPLLNDAEHDFYRRLRHALPEYQILPQVSLAALMHPTQGGRSGKAAQDRISKARVDYVIAARTDLSVLALVELDDTTPVDGRDAEQDQLTASAGYTTHHFSGDLRPSPLAIREQLLGLPTAEIVPLPRPTQPDR